MNCELFELLLHGDESVYLSQWNLVELEGVEGTERVNVKRGTGRGRGSGWRGHPQATQLVDKAVEVG